jgi:cytoplasmic iron level regulating protein YaaA (DUF328/UPF0246 family)
LLGAPVLPAGERFTGVVWDHLDLVSLPPAARQRARESIFVLSALAGVVCIDDPIPDHRLKFSVRLPRLGPLATYWREPLSAALNAQLDGRLVIDLLPNEHAAAWRAEPQRYDLRRVRFISRDGSPAGHFAKAAKGRLARSLLTSRSPARVLSTYDDDLFTLDIT